MDIAVRIDLNKTPERAIRHAFFVCPKCNGVADTTKQKCDGEECEVESVLMSMGCEKCNMISAPTHWEIH